MSAAAYVCVYAIVKPHHEKDIFVQLATPVHLSCCLPKQSERIHVNMFSVNNLMCKMSTG